MLSNLAFSTLHPRVIDSPSPRRMSPDRSLQACSQSKNILTVSSSPISPLQHRQAGAVIPNIRKTSSKPLYIDERDDDDTVSVLSDDEGLLLDTRFENDENENSGPSCSFGSTSQRQEYMGGNYFFRQNTSADENDYRDMVISFPSEDKSDEQHCPKENMEHLHSFPISSSPDVCKIEESNRKSDDLQHQVETLNKEKISLSHKCSKLEELISETRHDHNCYKAKMTMAMGSLRIRMESEREDKAYLLDKCQQLKQGFSELRVDYDAKLERISVLENQLRRSLRPTHQQQGEEKTYNL